MTAISKTRKQLKKRAREILFSGYPIFLFATLFFIALSFGFKVLSENYCSLLTQGVSKSISDTVFLTLDIVSFLLYYPFVLGYTSLCVKLSGKKDTALSELFRFYSSPRELLSCFAFLLKNIPQIFLRLVLPFIALSAAYTFLPMLLELISDMGFVSAAYIISSSFFLFELAIIALVMLLSGSLILSVIRFCDGTRYKYTLAEKRSFFVLRLSLIPIYLLSVLSFGILFIAYTIPYTFILYSLFSVKDTVSNDKLSSNTEYDILGKTAIFDAANLKKED